MNDHQFLQLLDWFGLSWSGYRKVRKGVKKRIARHMQQLGYRRMDKYLLALEHPALKEQTQRLLTVSISRFFRDVGLWQFLEKHVLTGMIAKGSETIKVWSAGCACGEEAYSFRMLWEILRGRLARLPKLKLWATDLNPEVLAKARVGIYSSSSLKELPATWRQAYFKPVDPSSYAISDLLQEGIRWKRHNLLCDDPPQIGFHIIFLRNNLLTYYREELQRVAFRKVLQSLLPGGFLIIGTHETLPCECPELLPLPSQRHIFEKAETRRESSESQEYFTDGTSAVRKVHGDRKTHLSH
jgi:chemotaxis methyl-accepting protein methylase